MGRKNNNAGGTRFDTRMSLRELCDRAGVNVHQRILMIRLLKKYGIKQKMS